MCTKVSRSRAIIHIVFLEQAVCRRGTKIQKGLLEGCRSYSYEALPLPGTVRDNISTVQRTEPTRGREKILGKGIPRGVVVNVLDCDIELEPFELLSSLSD